ncbi:hypothetical protein ACJIZ3_010645 [Penstemon smallii]|uniref:non-specific serine/threonine protein kinase n=1 Tax=Penstemon smallii TaxID=265156 RepID=A0ABD3UKY9_9LAMI
MGKQATIFLIFFYLMEVNSSTDEHSLLAIKSHIITSDPNNTLASNWSQGTSFCTWIGITCSRRRPRVMALDLFNMGLQGTIAKEIGNLSFLKYLRISNNSFNGVIPDEIGNLRRLRWVRMSHNQLSGEIPLSFGFLTNLEWLSIEYNHMTGTIPWSIFNISSLQTIGFTGNQLYGNLPNDMCYHLPKLVGLYLSFNQLSGDNIPTSLSACSQLSTLSLAYNNFSGRIPTHMGNLSQLQRLYLNSNKLSGTIPSQIGHLSKLISLVLGENLLKGELLSSVFNLSRLHTLSLTQNELTGTIPSFIDKGLPNLQFLYLGRNRFSGNIPNSISNLSSLSVFGITFNSFIGHIPINLGNLRSLQKLGLGGNQFTNDLSIPEQEFLTSLSNCKNLTSLQISYNPITGSLPKSLGSSNISASLETFEAEKCNISGTIPSEFGNLSSLFLLNLGNNNLTGMIPETLGHLRDVQHLSIHGNKLHGPIPNSFCDLKNLFYISLKENRLSGQLPSCLGNLPSLSEIYLYDNFFNSSIPSTLWSSNRLQIVSISHNLFEGYLSDAIGNMNSLRGLNLSRNQLSGIIPSSIGELQSLTYLWLDKNKFNGSIPSSLGNMRALQYLDLSQNNLSGSIPMSLENLRYLDYFNVSFNELTGQIPDGGCFRNFTSELFIGNKGLCGTSRFNVEVCKRHTPKSSRRNLMLRYILPPVALIILVATAIMIYLFKFRGKHSALLSFSESNLGFKHKRISYYEILRATENLDIDNLIGKGSIGSVYKGTFFNEMIYAIKVFDLDVQGSFKSFDTECQIMRIVRHRNLVKVITSCSNLDFKALVLEYMPNGNLEKWIHSPNYSLNIGQRLGIMIDVASAIEYLHQGYSSPVVHCDLKPSNILLDEDMLGRVGDFGIAKLLTHDQRMAQTKTLGTIGYMSPEYGSGGLVSTFVDVYSYGILLMEIFTKKRPTDELFLGELTMKRWVSESFPSTIMQIVDTELLNADEEYSVKANIEECLVSIMELAIECAADLPDERPTMKDVNVRLKKINIKVAN